VRCPHCQEDNPAAAKFCLACGTPLRRTCRSCGTDLPAHARYCFECGEPVAPARASAPEPSSAAPAAAAPVGPPVHAEEFRVIVDRRAVLGALYHQGLDALRRGDGPAAVAALVPVVGEALDVYPDAGLRLEEAQRCGTRPAMAVVRSRWLGAPRDLAAALRRRARHAAPRVAAPWRALDHAPWLGMSRRGLWPAGVIAAVLALALGGALLARSGAGPTAGTPAAEAAPVPTVEPDADVFARCQAAVAATNWADAIRACRVLHARDPDYAGLADKLAAAYVGRGQQRLDAGDIAGAGADFEAALGYQPESADAQQAWQRLDLYRQGDKALGVGAWDTAVSQLSADYAQAPDYLQNLGERSLAGKLFLAWLRWGQSALNAGDLPDAAQRCGQALALVPDDPEAQGCAQAAAAVNAGDAGED